MSLSERDLRLTRALADIVTASIIQDQAAADQDAVNEQLQTALDTRVLLEQAKGLLAQAGGLAMPDAYAELGDIDHGHHRRTS